MNRLAPILIALSLAACSGGPEETQTSAKQTVSMDSPAPEAEALPMDSPAMDSINEQDMDYDDNQFMPDEQIVVSDHP